jgi:hypothetical protein
MSSQQKNSKAETVARMQAMIQGLQKRFPNGQFTLGNKAFTTAALVQTFQGLIDAIQKVNAAQASAEVAVTAMTSTKADVNQVFVGLKRNLLNTFGTDAETLGDFGLEPRKAPAPRTTEQKAATTAKMRATRKARGTTSKKQKLAIKGDVTGVIVTPTTAQPSAAPTPTQPVTTTK